MRPVAMDVAEIALRTIEELRMAHPGRTIEWLHTGDCTVDGDPDRLAQVTSNLVANALAHGATDHPVRVEVRGGPSVVLSVTNEGANIPAAVHARMFKPFHRGTDAGASQRSVGLGLYIVDHIVRAHRGRITAHSENGLTTFVVSLPKTQSSPLAEAPPVGATLR